MSSPALLLEDVSRAFGGRKVLDGISGTVKQGRIVGLLGRNGEGKTTLFKILLDLLAADAGRVEVLGRPADGTGRVRGLVGYVPERPAFDEFLSVEGVLDVRARFFAGWSATRARHLCKRLGLDLGARVAGASKGALAKLAWICAVAHAPKLLLLDEPTSGLDALVRDDLLGELVEELQHEGTTIVVSNHRMEELGGFLDEVWLLRDGRLASRKNVEELRGEACRLRARLKPGANVADLPSRPLRVDGPLVEFVAFEAAQADALAAFGGLEAVERTPLPLQDAFKLMLSEER